ncbi:hypothetical protein [Vibrio caribbeanicus]|uniref:Uncharacterized protein n=1 Tax=Vibrio caribbeanicus ATCC BAA-2122 TaxID=796620 RepID=E3BKF7_9VIBR|nr:hypothetical protein [Vibrio caribbeanicus]EFP96542.1 hypothetical protein VIBC2010_05179 [Vibrio caribbeanicus ATCC BAA-2122]
MSIGDFKKSNKPVTSSGGGYKPLDDLGQLITNPEPLEETIKQRAGKQKAARREELTYTEEDEKRWAKNRERVLTERFALGWMQSPSTQSQEHLFASLFTSETTQEHQDLIKRYNKHLNEPVREGEIVIIPTKEPEEDTDIETLKQLVEQAKVASLEMSKLLDEEVATLNRHFELFSHQLIEQVKKYGLPSDYHSQVSTGVGITSALVGQHLKNIQDVLLEINELYVAQAAMASRTGGVNYGIFTTERAALFKKLDGSFAMLSKRSVKLPIYKQVKKNLKLSTKSVIHNADEILKKGFVKDLGKRIANISIGISASRGLGYIGIAVGGASGVNSIYEACNVDGNGECGKTITVETAGFFSGIGGGILGGNLGAGAATGAVTVIALLVGVTASAPVLAIAAIGGVVVGGAIGGVAGTTAGKFGADVIYEKIESVWSEF